MKSYTNFVGIDIGKMSFIVSIHNKKAVSEYSNDWKGISKFIRENKNKLAEGLVILEATGGYEMELVLSLNALDYPLHRADSRKVKNFIRSYGNDSKTDKLDARALALYGFERHKKLELFTPQSKKMLDLYKLIQRRLDLVGMLTSEKNRSKTAGSKIVTKSCLQMIKHIEKEIERVTDEIEVVIASDKELSEKKEILKTLPGIGDIIASELIALMPELGHMNRRQVASLAGVAPRANDSGKYCGYRITRKGRKELKPILFIAAMSARRTKTEFATFYKKLVDNGKKKIVALVALMRKIIVIANAKIKNFLLLQKHS